jgi:hypothetical protein
MNLTFIIPLSIIILIVIAIRVLNKRAAVSGKPMPTPLSREWFLLNGLLMLGGVVIVVGGVIKSWDVQVIGLVVAVIGLSIIWWRRLRNQF